VSFDGTVSSRVPEPPFDTDLRICDSHQHFWTHRGSYLLEDFIADIEAGGHNIVSTVCVECGSSYRDRGPDPLRPVGETKFLDEIATTAARRRPETSVAAGIVGYADLTLGEAVAPVLEAHIEASPKRMKGIRQSAAWDADPSVRTSMIAPPRLLGSDAFRAGFACLARYGLSFEAWLFHPQLTELADLAMAFPDAVIILNHAGGLLGVGSYRGRQADVLDDWRRSMAGIATLPNVVVKLGGLGMPRCGIGWSDPGRAPPTSRELMETTRPYYLSCIETFGPQRCMFESNFPVDKGSYGYGNVWNAFKLLTEGFSDSERALLFHDTAARVYRLD
jgi:predicted TIM-barrel fold metal-dependent hydrolase